MPQFREDKNILHLAFLSMQQKCNLGKKKKKEYSYLDTILYMGDTLSHMV